MRRNLVRRVMALLSWLDAARARWHPAAEPPALPPAAVGSPVSGVVAPSEANMEAAPEASLEPASDNLNTVHGDQQPVEFSFRPPEPAATGGRAGATALGTPQGDLGEDGVSEGVSERGSEGLVEGVMGEEESMEWEGEPSEPETKIVAEGGAWGVLGVGGQGGVQEGARAME